MKGSSVDTPRLLDISGRLGDLVIDPSIWPNFLEDICAAAGAAGAVLHQSDERTSDVPRTASFHEPLNVYFQRSLHLTDLRAIRAAPKLLNGVSVVVDQDLITPEEMRSDVMYNEALISNGFQWFAGVGFWAGSALWGLCVQRTSAEGPFEEADKRALAVLSGRLTEIATLSTAVGRIALSSGANALAAVNKAAVAVDRSGFVLDANDAAVDLFDDDLHIKGRRLYVGDNQARNTLHTLLDRMRMTDDTVPLPAEPILVRRRDKSPVIIRILPIHGAARSPFLGARALLTFTVVGAKAARNLSYLAKAFGLTPAEARLAALIIRGRSPTEAAEQLGVSRATARNQLRALFAKTDTHRQSELVALLASV